MTFITTGLLIAGSVAVGVPILIHLLSRQRRRPIEWAAMRFLMEALRKHRRRLQLEQLILLAVRCLIVFLLGAALARPFLESAGLLEGGASRAVFLVVDNGLASGALRDSADPRSSTLAESVDTAVALVESLGPGDTVGLITAARPARGLVVPASSDHGAIIELLRSLEPSEAPTDLAAALPILRSALEELGPESDRAVAYLLSDFREGSAQLDATLPLLSVGGSAEPALLASPAARDRIPNMQVTAVEPLRGLVLSADDATTGQVTVSIARSGGELPRDVTRVRLSGEGLPPIEPRTIEWNPGDKSADVDFVVNLGGRDGDGLALTVAIDDDALPADNVRHTVLLSRARVRALLVDRRHFGADPDLDRLRSGQWLQRALQPSDRSPIDVVTVDPAALGPVDVRGIDTVLVTRPDLLALEGWQVLGDYVRGGGVLIVTPPGDANVHAWTTDFVNGIDLPWQLALETSEPVEALTLAGEQPHSELLRLIDADLTDLAQPVFVQRVLPVDRDQTQAETVLAFADGSPLIIAGSPRHEQAGGPADGNGNGNGNGAAAVGQNGLVIYLATSPDLAWTNLPSQPLMVPLVHELVKQSIGIVRTAQRYSVGERPALGLGPVASALQDPRGARISIDASGRPDEPLARAGLYGIMDPGAQPIGALAVNIDPRAGRTDPQDQAAVDEWLMRSGPWQTFNPDDPTAALRTADTGASLSGLLLMIVLGLVVLETALARWFSHALPPGRAQGLAGADELTEAMPAASAMRGA